jgi:hypothetical protein
MRCVAAWIFAVGVVALGVLPASTVEAGEDRKPLNERMWRQMVDEAEGLGLPTKFLKVIPPSFVQFEFDDLHSYAAEYHLGEHRLVLNRVLSFNGAGATLRPLGRLTHAEIETLYHELFHAYIDYLVTAAEKSPEIASDPVLAVARVQQGCHYGAVLINPVVQRKSETEERFLTERESWEALNETWAIFVGWVVWNHLELTGSTDRSIQKSAKRQDEWLSRLRNADQEGTFRGYYEPEDPGERAVTRKRYLAPASRLSETEAIMLLRSIAEFPPKLLTRAKEFLSGPGQGIKRHGQC